jgi:predicted unusual protein kinase regulating ubiquinone biosynthesis (AarF/ABC1/UbiB family)
VHRARLHDGREVVVKVKYPQVERVFGADMATIETFCRIAQPEQVRVGDVKCTNKERRGLMT